MSRISSEAPAVHASRLFDVAGRAYVVTGAASGLGLAISEVLVANDASVLMLDRDASGIEEAAARTGRGAEGGAIDVTDVAGLQCAIDGFVEKTGRIDGLFANAGISGGAGFGTVTGAATGRLENQENGNWDAVLGINLLGVVNSLKAVVPAMKRQRRGSIVITASIAGMKVESFVAYSYAAAKAAVIQLMRQSALEMAPFGIRVNAIAPGYVRTAIGGGRLHDSTVEAILAQRIPMRRLGAPREIQGIALLLASDAASYMTGSLVPIDGGALLGPSFPIESTEAPL